MSEPASKFPTVRIALQSDEDRLMEMCRNLHAENGMFKLNEDKVRKLMRHCYARKNSLEPPVIVGAIEGPETLEGSICMVLTDNYYSDDTHLDELWNFVDRPYRQSRNAESLLRFGEEVAKKLGVPFITGIVTNKSMVGKVRLYRRILGPPAGAFFVRNSSWVAEPVVEFGDLAKRLREVAALCDSRFKFSEARKHVAPLMKQAADALSFEGNPWAEPPKSAREKAASHG